MPLSIPSLGFSAGTKIREQDFNAQITGPNFGNQVAAPSNKPGGIGVGGQETSQLLLVGGVLIVGIVVVALLSRAKGKRK